MSSESLLYQRFNRNMLARLIGFAQFKCWSPNKRWMNLDNKIVISMTSSDANDSNSFHCFFLIEFSSVQLVFVSIIKLKVSYFSRLIQYHRQIKPRSNHTSGINVCHFTENIVCGSISTASFLGDEHLVLIWNNSINSSLEQRKFYSNSTTIFRTETCFF